MPSVEVTDEDHIRFLKQEQDAGPAPSKEKLLMAALSMHVKNLEDAEKARLSRANAWGDGCGGPFDFSRQGSLLQISLQAAVPLWINELEQLKERQPDGFWDHLQRTAHDAGQFLAEHGDALMFKVKGTTSQAFNHLAKGIACMSFCPGGVKVFGSHWETKSKGVA